MKSIIVLSVLSLSHIHLSASYSVTYNNTDLPAPKLKVLTVFDPSGVEVEWDPVDNDVVPILGYKLNIWDPEFDKLYSITPNDEVIVTFIPVNRPLNEIPKSEPIIITVGANETSAVYESLRPNVEYQLRVQAFNEDGKGPMSEAMLITLDDKESDKKN